MFAAAWQELRACVRACVRACNLTVYWPIKCVQGTIPLSSMKETVGGTVGLHRAPGRYNACKAY